MHTKVTTKLRIVKYPYSLIDSEIQLTKRLEWMAHAWPIALDDLFCFP